MDLGDNVTLKEFIRSIEDNLDLDSLLAFFGQGSIDTLISTTTAREILISPDYGLFEYQRTLAERAWEKLDSGPKTVALHLPTGSGKTRTAMHLIARHLCTYTPSVVIWLAHSKELLEQAASEFERAWKSLGNREVRLAKMWGSYDTDPLDITDGIIIASLQKLHQHKKRDLNNFLRLADRAHLTVIDEAHIAVAPTYRRIVEMLSSKRLDNRLLGLTATPGRSWADVEADRELSDLFNDEKIMLEVEGFPDPVTYLITQGYLAKPIFRLLNSEPGLDLSDEDRRSLLQSFDFSDEILDRLGVNALRNLRIVEAAKELLTHHKRVLLFAPSVLSARIVHAVLSSLGIISHIVTANTPAADRDQAIARFKGSRPEPMVLCNFGVLTTGFDAPQTSAALIARPTLSLVLYSQMVGRATRGPRAGGNDVAEIVTVVDPELPGFGKIEEAFRNWEDVWNGSST